MPPFEYPLNASTKLAFETSDRVFVPTGTTRLLIESVRKHVATPGSLLDLGCGIGVVGATLHRFGAATDPLYASDLSPEAVQLTMENCNRNGVQVIARRGSIFEPWQGHRFNYIVDDVSGIAEAIGKVSNWFSGTSCLSGRDGADLVVEVIRKAPEYLMPDGKLFFPILSLSNQRRIMEEAAKQFKQVKRLKRVEWPLPDDMRPHIEMLRELKRDGNIDFSEKFGMVIWTTEIFVAFNEDGISGSQMA